MPLQILERCCWDFANTSYHVPMLAQIYCVVIYRSVDGFSKAEASGARLVFCTTYLLYDHGMQLVWLDEAFAQVID